MLFDFIGKHWCFKSDAGSYRNPAEGVLQWGDVREFSSSGAEWGRGVGCNSAAFWISCRGQMAH